MKKAKIFLLLLLLIPCFIFASCTEQQGNNNNGNIQTQEDLKLKTPTEVRVETYNGKPVIFFNTVENALEYQVKIFKDVTCVKSLTVSPEEVPLGILVSDLKSGTYDVTVKAVASFDSKYTSSDTSEKVSFEVVSTVTPTNKYTVTFNTNGGSSVTSQTVEEGKTVTKPANPTKTGYIFVEWQLNGKTYDFTSKVTENIILVANWKVDDGTNPVTTYTVTFNSNGGSSVATQTVEAGKVATKPSEPTKSGYKFVEWQLNGASYSFTTPVTSNITLVAKWELVNNTTDYISYYDSAEGLTGSQLKAKLRTIISNYSNATSYSDLTTDLAYTDQDPEDSSKIMQFYTRISVAAKWDSGATWNREHIWPQSKGWFSTSGAGSDIHHIRPTSNNVNSTRGSKPYGEVSGGTVVYDKKTNGKAGYYSSSYFMPLDDVKGDVARIIFYLLTRYSNSDSYAITQVASSIGMLLKWHEADPVDEFERVRNERSYEIQGNRNPFIDYPEFADMIFG